MHSVVQLKFPVSFNSDHIGNVCRTFTTSISPTASVFLFRTILSFLRNSEYRTLLFTSSLVLAAGTLVYHWLEGWTWVDSFYFSVITLTTIGYGDLHPITDFGKLFTVVYIVVGLGLILGFINAVYDHYKDQRSNGPGPR
jgi:voltage-gated potassium channel